MRLFLFLLFFSPALLAQIDTGNGAIANCTDADIVNGGDIQCGDLTITAGFPGFNPGAAAVDIRVQGNVTISGNLNLDGGAGPSDIGIATAFGAAGPGASDGGDANFGTPLSATGASGGGAGNADVGCGSGGGGGGFATAALSAGTLCGAAAGGTLGPIFNNIFVQAFRGGFGGGCGGYGPTGTTGTGGGGGGAIRIRAGGDILISADITANGGDGGDNATDGGGGGGGSGGLIWIQALGSITNNGNMSADGGAGGTSAAGGSGGTGGRGAVKLEDLDGVIDGVGTLPSYAITTLVSPLTSSTSTLKSDISCGSIASKKDSKSNSLIMQVMLGFALAMVISIIGRRLKFFA